MSKVQSRSEFVATFERLRSLLQPYADSLVLMKDESAHYSLDTPHVERFDRPLFFGAARIMKNYVSYHLMPVYMYPDLLDDLPDVLRKRMQGKSCFNFKTLDEREIAALQALTQSCFDRLIVERVIPAPS